MCRRRRPPECRRPPAASSPMERSSPPRAQAPRPPCRHRTSYDVLVSSRMTGQSEYDECAAHSPLRTTRLSFPELLFRVPDLLVDIGAVDRVAVARQRTCPRGDRIVVAAQFEEHVAVVVLDD